MTPYHKVGEVNDWWEMARTRPAFREFSTSPLKDFGYLQLLADLKVLGSRRVLEIGPGLNVIPGKNLFELLPDAELWGVDDCQNLHYFPGGDEWLAAFSALQVRFPGVRFVRGLLGQEPMLSKLPRGYFDAVVSVSVLEEIPHHYETVIPHCYELLRPGGWMLGSADFCATPTPAYPWANNLQKCVECMLAAGFEVPKELPLIDRFSEMLLENPVGVMIGYEGSEGENRRYWGHFGTLYTAARKQ